MLKISNIRDLAIAGYALLIPFERLQFLPIILFMKVLALVLVSCHILSTRRRKKISILVLYPYLILLILMVSNYLNRSPLSNEIIYSTYLLNLLVFSVIAHDREFRSLSHFVWDCFFVSCVFLSIIGLLGVNVIYFDGRISVCGLNANYVAIYCAYSISIALIDFIKRGVTSWKFYCIAPLFYLLLKTESRSGIFLVIVLLAFLLFYHGNLNKQKLFLALLGVIAIFIGFFILPGTSFYLRILSTINNGDISSRDLIWTKIFDELSLGSLLGIGRNGYMDIVHKLGLNDGGFLSPHNVFIEIFIYTGLVGLFVYSSFMFVLLRSALRSMKLRGDITLIYTWTVLFLMSMSAQILEQKFPWLLFALLIQEMLQSQNKKNASYLLG